MAPQAHVVLLDDPSGAPRLVPSAPMGRWAMGPLTSLMGAMEPGTRMTVDLKHAPVSEPCHVAAILWLEGQARMRGLELAIQAGDPVSSELLDFSGLPAAATG